MLNDIENSLIEILIDLNLNFEKEELNQPTIDTNLYGPNGILDSIELVMLVAEIESFISDKYEIDIVLADEKAMSQKISPFRSVRSLATYIDSLLN